MNNGIPVQNPNAQHGVGHAAQEPWQQQLVQPQLNPVEIQQGQGLGLQPLGERRLEDLPESLLLEVVAGLQGGHDMVRNINALANLSKRSTLKDAITTIPPGKDVLSKFHLLDGVTRAINRCISELVASHSTGQLPYFTGCGPILALLSPAKRTALIQSAMNMNDPTEKGKAIADLSLGMAHLAPEERDGLVLGATGIYSADNLIDTDLSGMNIAIAGLLEGQVSLSPVAREALADLADTLVGLNHVAGQPDSPLENSTVQQLGAAIRFLPPEKLAKIVDSSINEPVQELRSHALANMGVIMANVPNLNAEVRVLNAALQLDVGSSMNRVITSLAARIGAMQPPHLQQVIDTALSIEHVNWSARAARQLGAKAEHLSDPQRQTLVDLATPPNVASINLDVGWCVCERLCGLAEGMRGLNADQRERLVMTARGFTFATFQSKALGALGLGLEHLVHTQHEHLVTAAIQCGQHSQNQDQNMINAITGLGAGARHLDFAQRERLIGAVSSVNAAGAPAMMSAKLRALSVIATSVMEAN